MDVHCCRACDREQWPEKITETEARKQYKLFKHRYPTQGSALRREVPSVVPSVKLRYGTYYCMGVCTTMYLRRDVEAFEEAMRESLDLVVVVVEREKRRERIKTPRERGVTVVVIDDDDDDDDAMGVVEGGGEGGAVFQEPIVIDDD